MTRAHLLLPLGLLPFLASCSSYMDYAPSQEASAPVAAKGAPADTGSYGGESKKRDRFAMRSAPSGGAAMPASMAAAPPPAEAAEMDGYRGDFADADDKMAEEEPAPSAEPATRSWFPETFLFEPMVETDAAGRASVPVVVPDRLTTWRVLGLAHDRTGGLAGATTSFVGTLPTYVDPIIPAFLYAGDAVRLPVQVVNTTGETASGVLSVDASGAATASARSPVQIPAGGSFAAAVELSAPRSGIVTLKARFGDADQVVRTFDVKPTGRKVEQTRAGTLAAPRVVELTGAADLDPHSAQLRLLVYPGALALLRNELALAGGRGTVADTAHALMLAGRAPELLAALGDPIEPDSPEGRARAAALRELELVSTQRALRAARAPDLATTALLVEAAATHPESAVLSRLSTRLLNQLVADQRPDGTFGGSAAGWPVQRLLMLTADATRAATETAKATEGTDSGEQNARTARAVRLKASGAFERLGRVVGDPYTAAAMAASGAVTGEYKAELQAVVRAAIEVRPDGSRALPVPEGAVRADGSRPSEVEATALAVLALAGDAEAPWRADLGATVLAAYHPGWGWGDGRANLTCLGAVLDLFQTPLPEEIQIVLEQDGKVLDEAVLNKAALREIAVLTAPAAGAAGDHSYTIRAEPAVPGLGFSLTLETRVPWEATPPMGGLELSITPPTEARVGQSAAFSVVAAAPARRGLRVDVNLPAGVQAEEESLRALVSVGTITAYDSADGLVTLHVPALDPGQIFNAAFSVVPTLAGTLSSGPTVLSLADQRALSVTLPPTTWTVGG